MPGRPLSLTSSRIVVYAMTHPGASPAQIAKQLQLPYHTVYSVLKRHKGKIERKAE